MAYTDRYVTAAGGGAHDGTSEADAWTWDEMVAAIDSNASGFRINVKTGSHVATASTSLTCSAGNPCHIRGYHTTPGDLASVRNADGTLNTTNFPTVDLQLGFSGNAVLVENLILTDSTGANSTLITATSAGMQFRACKITQPRNNADAIAVSLASLNTLFMCDIENTGASSLAAVTVSNTGGALFDCRVKGGAGMGISTTGTAAGAGLLASQCVIYESSYGVSIEATGSGISAGFSVISCTIKGNTNDGIRNSSSANTSGKVIANCHITDNGGYGINNRGGTTATINLWNNRFRDNTSGSINSQGDWLNSHAVTADNGDATTDYVDPSNDNFFLLPPAAGRRASKLANRDIGAHQSATQIYAAFAG